MHFNLVLLILSASFALAKGCHPFGRVFQSSFKEPYVGGTELFHELTNAVKNGKELDFGHKEKYAYVCLTRKTPVTAAWMELFRGGASKLHISFEQVANKPNHYKAIFRGDIPTDGKSQEYFQMFKEGGELKIVKENGGLLFIESSKLNTTYIFTEGEQGCALMDC